MPKPSGLPSTSVILALVVAMGIGRFAYTPILPVMQATFGLSNGMSGALASSNYLGYLVGALLAAAVPIVLHLLKREPEARVKFSAVRLLRRAPVELIARHSSLGFPP